ncbi:phage tail spike protein [Companilactobacillus sp. DQM5]|uniref:phage tail spike protein n=1 Tax=Companilactobacillus sp. DQM5 TaxID=3463359 RepID=UPI004058F66E
MNWFIFSRDMHVLCNPSTDSKDSLPIYNDKQNIVISNNTVVSTYDFTVPQNHPDAKFLKYGNYIVFKDKYEKTKMYTLIEFDGDDTETDWHAEDVGLDLLNETADKWDFTGQPHDIKWYLENHLLFDTGWTVGINEVSDLTRALKFEGQSDTSLKRLGDIANQFDGAEVDFTIELNGNLITKQEINIYKKIGSKAISQRFVDSQNLISLNSKGSIADLKTALIGYGSQPESTDGKTNEAPITFKDINYDDGQFFSPYGSEYLMDRVNHQQWSRYSGYDPNNPKETNGYIVGIYSYDTKDPQELLKRTITQLQKVNHPNETYEANLLDIKADIGDYVQIAHNNFNPPIYLSARVESVTNCYTQKGQDTGTLGDYSKLTSNVDQNIKDILNNLNGVTINNSTMSSSTVKGSKMVNEFKYDEGGGTQAVGTSIIENGAFKIDYKEVLGNGADGLSGEVQLYNQGFQQTLKDSSGKVLTSMSLTADGLTLINNLSSRNTTGQLTAEDIDSAGPIYYKSSNADGSYVLSLEKHFRKVWISGVIVLPQASFPNYVHIFDIPDTKMRTKINRYIFGNLVGNNPIPGMLEVRPDGSVWAAGVPQAGRYSFESKSYSTDAVDLSKAKFITIK